MPSRYTLIPNLVQAMNHPVQLALIELGRQLPRPGKYELRKSGVFEGEHTYVLYSLEKQAPLTNEEAFKFYATLKCAYSRLRFVPGMLRVKQGTESVALTDHYFGNPDCIGECLSLIIEY